MAKIWSRVSGATSGALGISSSIYRRAAKSFGKGLVGYGSGMREERGSIPFRNVLTVSPKFISRWKGVRRTFKDVRGGSFEQFAHSATKGKGAYGMGFARVRGYLNSRFHSFTNKKSGPLYVRKSMLKRVTPSRGTIHGVLNSARRAGHIFYGNQYVKLASRVQKAFAPVSSHRSPFYRNRLKRFATRMSARSAARRMFN
jgi:hypothetical protein